MYGLQELEPPLLGFGVHLQISDFFLHPFSKEFASSHLVINEQTLLLHVQTPSVPSNPQLFSVLYEAHVDLTTQFDVSAKQFVKLVHYFTSVISLHNFNLHLLFTVS